MGKRIFFSSISLLDIYYITKPQTHLFGIDKNKIWKQNNNRYRYSEFFVVIIFFYSVFQVVIFFHSSIVVCVCACAKKKNWLQN